MAEKKKAVEDKSDLSSIRKRFGLHLLVLFSLLGAFCFSAVGTVTGYGAKMKLLSVLSDIRILRTETTTEKLRYLYTYDKTANSRIIENYSIMYDSFSEALGLEHSFSSDVSRLKVLTSEERRIFTTLVAQMQYRGFTGVDGEYELFLKLDGELQQLFRDMGIDRDGRNKILLDSDFQYDFSKALSEADRDFAVYSHFVLETTDHSQLHEKVSLVADKLEEMRLKLPKRAPNMQARDKAEHLLYNKAQIFTRIISYDIRIMQCISSLKETERGVSSLLEKVYENLQSDLRHIRTISFVMIGMFFLFVLGVVITLSLFISRTTQYTLRRDVRIAELANKAKTDFLSNISHEIRSPLNAVLGLDELIIRESRESNIVGYAMSIERSGKTLLSLINDVLDFSKIEAGKIEIIPVEYDITSMVGDLYNMISPRIQEKKLTLNIHISEDLPQLLVGDEVRIKQCVLNILTNAVKYTNEGSVTLDISWKQIDGQIFGEEGASILLMLRISDTGIGIKEADMPKLFKAFERIEERRNRTIEGSGLGMAIVNNLLNLMDAKLDVKSEYGKGSSFCIMVEQAVSDWTPVGPEASEAYKKQIPRLSLPRDSFTAPEARILVVDDTAVNLTVVKGLLRPTLIQVDTALSGHEALKLVAERHYDIIFLDHRMPVMDGIETLRFMQTLDTNLNKDVPVIALTANAVSGAKEMYLKEGFADYLSKPIDIVRLEEMIQEYLPQGVMQIGELEAVTEEMTSGSLSLVKGIDFDAALTNCGSEEVLESALIEYYKAIDEKASAIEAAFTAADWKNYTVYVHGVKSSSRLIGATELSAEAEHLEHCSDIVQGSIQGDYAVVEMALDEITEKTADFLSRYRSYKEYLSAFVSAEEQAAWLTEDGSEKPMLDAETFRKALLSLRECMQIADFNLADQIIDMVDGYRLEEPLASQYKTVKDAVTAVDPAKVIAAIKAAVS
ncbi:MAG: response regulator [Treponema sp.]|nr:response regulator [Treponema sp.]